MQEKRERIKELTSRFYNPNIMEEWARYMANEEIINELYLDSNNILRDIDTDEGVASIGGNEEKAMIGLNITNPLRNKTSSYQYIFGRTNRPIIRQDGIPISGCFEELILGREMTDWMNENNPTHEQLISVLMQLYYAVYLLAEEGWDIYLDKVRIRQVEPDARVPFFEGSIATHGVIPVIVDVEHLQPATTLYVSRNVITYFLTQVANTKIWSPTWDRFSRKYDEYNLNDGENWDRLFNEGHVSRGNQVSTLLSLRSFPNIYSETEIANYSCRDKPCLGMSKDSVANNFYSADGKNMLAQTQQELDLHLLSLTNSDLPNGNLQSYANAFKLLLEKENEGDINFVLTEEDKGMMSDDSFNILDPDVIANIYLSLSHDRRIMTDYFGSSYRPVVASDFIYPSTIGNIVYIRDDIIRGILENGDVYVYSRGTITSYNPEDNTFTIETDAGTMRVDYHFILDDIQTHDQEKVETLIPVLRLNIVANPNQGTFMYYAGPDPTSLSPFPIERSIVYPTLSESYETIRQFNNAVDMMSLGLQKLTAK